MSKSKKEILCEIKDWEKISDKPEMIRSQEIGVSYPLSMQEREEWHLELFLQNSQINQERFYLKV